MSKFLVRGGIVLTLGPRTSNFAEADVLIDGDRIVEVGPGLRARDAELVDGSHSIVMPGFVDSHRHVMESLFRNFGDSPSGDTTSHNSPEHLYAATLIGLLGATEAGITTVVDWLGHVDGEEQVDAALQAHADSGLRTVIAVDSDREDILRNSVGRSTGDRTTISYGSPTPGASTNDRWALARKLGLRIHAHAGTDRAGSNLGTAALGPDVTLIHCTHLDDRSLDAVASARAQIVVTPCSEMAGGLGSPPIQRIIDRKIRPGLGVDNERLGPGDIFAQMRAIISVQHATYFELKLAGKAGLPNLLTTREVIRFGTIDGANAVGLGLVTGSLEPGKQADFVLLRTDRPNIVPVNDPIGAVVWGMDTSNVDWVFVAGEPVMRAGALAADVPRARDLAVQAQARMADAAGRLTTASTTDPR
jgi:cytosine/adenosine deaminase-related metal-dependent hydrolase